MNRVVDEDRRAGRIAVGIVLALVVLASAWWWWSKREEAPPPVADAGDVATVPLEDDIAPPEPAPIQHPLDMPEHTVPEPDETPTDPDVAARAALDDTFGPSIADWLITEQLARRLVATLDNLPRNTRIEPLRPVRPPSGPVVVERETLDAAVGEERIVLSEVNFARYDGAVALLADMDAAAAAAAYRRVYPQLQAAYEEIGYPGRYFNDRMVAVIDHLLGTPEPTGPLLLEQPKVLYRFVDAHLESLSPGQKLLLRIGPAHARTVKQKLAEFRAQIAAAPANNKE